MRASSAVESYSASSVCSCLRVFVRSHAGFDPGCDQHGERIARPCGRRRRPATSRSPALVSMPLRARRRGSRARDRRASRAPIPRRAPADRGSSTRPPGTVMRAASATARAGSCAWWSACESSATSTAVVLDRQLLELAALPDDVRDAAPPREAAGAFEHDLGPIDGDHPRRPARRLDRQIAFAAAEIGDLERRQQHARAPATRPPSSGPARAAARRACRRRRACRSSPCAAAAPPAAAPRRRARPDRSAAASNCSSSAGHRASLSIVAQRRREPVVGVAGVLFLDDEARRPSAGRDGATRPTARGRGCR